MILNTHPSDRKEMVRAIGERIALPARHMGIKSEGCCFFIPDLHDKMIPLTQLFPV